MPACSQPPPDRCPDTNTEEWTAFKPAGGRDQRYWPPPVRPGPQWTWVQNPDEGPGKSVRTKGPAGDFSIQVQTTSSLHHVPASALASRISFKETDPCIDRLGSRMRVHLIPLDVAAAVDNGELKSSWKKSYVMYDTIKYSWESGLSDIHLEVKYTVCTPNLLGIEHTLCVLGI